MGTSLGSDCGSESTDPPPAPAPAERSLSQKAVSAVGAPGQFYSPGLRREKRRSAHGHTMHHVSLGS